MKASFTTYSSWTCPLSSWDALNMMATRTCACTVYTAYRRHGFLTAHLADCSVHPEQKVEYPIPDDREKNINSSKQSQKRFQCLSFSTLILRPLWCIRKIRESAFNTKVQQLHKPSGFTCLRVSQVPEFNGEIFTYSVVDSMTPFRTHQRSGLLRPKHLIRRETDEDSNGGATVATRCGYNLSRKIYKEKQKDEASLPS